MVAISASLALSLSGCSTVLTGIPEASSVAAQQSTVDSSDLGALLIAPDEFPDEYTAQVLEYRDAVLASGDLSGVSRDTRINPVRCQPSATPVAEQDLSMISGMNEADQSTLAVVLTRTDEALASAEDTISRCLDVVSDQYGVQSQITRSFLPPPVKGGEGAFAYAQTVSSGSGEVALVRRSSTLLAQVGDVRVAVIGMSQHEAEVDRAVLEQVLELAVSKLE